MNRDPNSLREKNLIEILIYLLLLKFTAYLLKVVNNVLFFCFSSDYYSKRPHNITSLLRIRAELSKKMFKIILE